MAVYVVCGPPGSGKTTYVTGRKRTGDLVVDLDALFAALSGEAWYDKSSNLLPVVLDVRDWIVENIPSWNKAGRFYNAWAITSNPETRHRLARKLGAKEVVVIETSYHECLARIGNDERRRKYLDHWTPLVQKWWDKYEPDPADTVIAGGKTR